MLYINMVIQTEASQTYKDIFSTLTHLVSRLTEIGKHGVCVCVGVCVNAMDILSLTSAGWEGHQTFLGSHVTSKSLLSTRGRSYRNPGPLSRSAPRRRPMRLQGAAPRPRTAKQICPPVPLKHGLDRPPGGCASRPGCSRQPGANQQRANS